MTLAGTPLSEGMHQFEALMDELPGGMSRKIVTVKALAANPILEPGFVLGRETGAEWTAHDNAVATGAETLAWDNAGILLGATGPNGPNVTSLTGEPALIVFQKATVNEHFLKWAAGMDTTEQAAALASLRASADIFIDAR